MNDALNGRQPCIWRGKDPHQDLKSLGDAIVKVGVIFEQNGQLVYLNTGKPASVNGPALREIISKNVVVPQLVNRDGSWSVNYEPFIANNAVVFALLNPENKESGLIGRVPPATPGRGCS
jgi:hypothetical protein